MKSKEKARSAGGTAKQATGSCERAAQQSHTDYTTHKRDKASVCIFDLLPVGADHAISRRELTTLTGLPDRQLRRQIAAERMEGLLILSSTAEVGGGYFRAANVAELRRWVAMMQSHISAVLAVIRAAQEAIAEAAEGADNE